MNTRPTCPTPGKKRYPSRDHADEGMAIMWRRGTHGGYLPVRVYLCPCGSWHLTHKPARHTATTTTWSDDS